MVGNVTRDKNGTIIKFGMSVKKNNQILHITRKLCLGFYIVRINFDS